MQEQIEARKTYTQNWRAYNSAQTSEKDHFLVLLRDLCHAVDEPDQSFGRPRLMQKDRVFAAIFKVFSTVSGRRFMCDLRDAATKGYLGHALHYNSIYNALDDEALTPILHAMITETSRPLKVIETDFAVDSSGFSTSKFERWVDHKYPPYKTPRKRHGWVKVHLMCGVRTNIVTAVEIRDKNSSDAPVLPDLVQATANTFSISEVSADKAYGSFRNYDAISATGGVPFIPFKESRNERQQPKPHLKSELWGYRIKDEKRTKNVLWNKMYHFFRFHQDEYMAHYHKRSNVETTFSMIKRKFGDSVRSKTDRAQMNEVLAKIVCHNICCLIQESHELGIDTDFQKYH